MAPNFIVTKEHRRFAEFASAVRKEHTIGICHGERRGVSDGLCELIRRRNHERYGC